MKNKVNKITAIILLVIVTLVILDGILVLMSWIFDRQYLAIYKAEYGLKKHFSTFANQYLELVYPSPYGPMYSMNQKGLGLIISVLVAIPPYQAQFLPHLHSLSK